ncbi:hypothetical protein KKC83_01580 [Patescibacteria group bacterium]|nr:hypothetical protein [Candidatus Falkowbacteria bacterium]MBU4014750.1 hypothetical protein [Patescibacteria group bacterium]MBU4026216.1 hypothetical protein [Patescibacteria group bacterium]MBU4072717.1 hypothetical protein [Patescibacteria group bacterium]MBU4124868.1 hypothetical protein [Patescibacteria group bacterium]
MGKFISKYGKIIISIFILALVVFGFFYQIHKNKELIIRIKNIEKQLSNQAQNQKDETKIENINTLHRYNNAIDYSYYGGHVIRLGGTGSFIDQKLAYLLTETGYLKPAEDWVLVSYNRPGDLIHVGCREDYTMINCIIDGEYQDIDQGSALGCSDELGNHYRNDISIECKKEILEIDKDEISDLSYDEVAVKLYDDFQNRIIRWQGIFCGQSQISGIKLCVIDEHHPKDNLNKDKWFWGIPQIEPNIDEYKGKWATWMLKKYGNINSENLASDETFIVTGKFVFNDCAFYDNTCIPNIEVIKIEIKQNNE